jgi:hypothetical protein
MSNHRTFLKSAALSAPAAILGSTASLAQAGAPLAKKLQSNSILVEKLPLHFDVEPGIHNLENGYWGITPKSVAQVYAEQTAFVTKTNSIWQVMFCRVVHVSPLADVRHARQSLTWWERRRMKLPSPVAAPTHCSCSSPTTSTSRQGMP